MAPPPCPLCKGWNLLVTLHIVFPTASVADGMSPTFKKYCGTSPPMFTWRQQITKV